MAKKDNAPASPDEEFEAQIRDEQRQLRARRVNERRLDRFKAMTLTGVRLADETDPEVGMVVTFTDEEREPVLTAIRGVLEARLKE